MTTGAGTTHSFTGEGAAWAAVIRGIEEVSDLLLAKFKLDLLLNLFLDPLNNLYLWNFLHCYLFLHRMELHFFLSLQQQNVLFLRRRVEMVMVDVHAICMINKGIERGKKRTEACVLWIEREASSDHLVRMYTFRMVLLEACEWSQFQEESERERSLMTSLMRFFCWP